MIISCIQIHWRKYSITAEHRKEGCFSSSPLILLHFSIFRERISNYIITEFKILRIKNTEKYREIFLYIYKSNSMQYTELLLSKLLDVRLWGSSISFYGISCCRNVRYLDKFWK